MIQASMLRRRLGADNDSPLDILALAAGIENLTLVHYPMGENLSGICLKGEDSVIAINSAMSLGRRRFSLARELYHMWHGKESALFVSAKAIGSGGESEKRADTFASFALMPPLALETKADALASRREDGKLTFDDVIHIEQHFGASHQATVIRLKDSPRMKRSLVEPFLSRNPSERARILGYGTELYKPLPAGRQCHTTGRYIFLAGILREKGLISEGKYEELLLAAFRPDMVFGGDDGCVLD